MFLIHAKRHSGVRENPFALKMQSHIVRLIS